MAQATNNQLLATYSANTLRALMEENAFAADRFLGLSDDGSLDSAGILKFPVVGATKHLIPVTRSTFEFNVWGFDKVRRVNGTLLQSGDPTPSVRAFSTRTSGVLQEIRLQKAVTNDECTQHPLGEAGALRDATDIVTLANMYDWEARVAAMAVTGTQTGAAVAVWNNAAADAVTDIKTAAAAVWGNSGLFVNTVVMTYPDYQNLITGTSFRNFTKGSANAGQMTVVEVQNAIGNIIGRPIRLIIAAAAYNSAIEDAAATITGAAIWGSGSVILAHQSSNPNHPAFLKGFNLPAEDGQVYVGTSAPQDPAANVLYPQHKMKRVSLIAADGCGYRITGC